MKIKNILRPTIWKIILTLIILLFFYNIGKNDCYSYCSGLCLAVCGLYYSPYFFPFNYFLGNTTHSSGFLVYDYLLQLFVAYILSSIIVYYTKFDKKIKLKGLFKKFKNWKNGGLIGGIIGVFYVISLLISKLLSVDLFKSNLKVIFYPLYLVGSFLLWLEDNLIFFDLFLDLDGTVGIITMLFLIIFTFTILGFLIGKIMEIIKKSVM